MEDTTPLSLLVVDIGCEWEEWIKDRERGYRIDDVVGNGVYEKGPLARDGFELVYPHGSIRAGFDAITDAVRLAHLHGLPIYDVQLHSSMSANDMAPAIEPYVPEARRFMKHGFDAFGCEALAHCLAKDRCEHLLVMGYNRDICVHETVQGALSKGIRVVTSEHCMLAADDVSRKRSLAFFRERTTHLESLVDVWNYLQRHSRTGWTPPMP